MWQIFKFSTYKKFFSVEQLVIQLPGEQLVYFEENVVSKKLQEKIDSARSTFIVFLNIIILMKRTATIFIKNFLSIISI